MSDLVRENMDAVRLCRHSMPDGVKGPAADPRLCVVYTCDERSMVAVAQECLEGPDRRPACQLAYGRRCPVKGAP